MRFNNIKTDQFFNIESFNIEDTHGITDDIPEASYFNLYMSFGRGEKIKKISYDDLVSDKDISNINKVIRQENISLEDLPDYRLMSLIFNKQYVIDFYLKILYNLFIQDNPDHISKFKGIFKNKNLNVFMIHAENIHNNDTVIKMFEIIGIEDILQNIFNSLHFKTSYTIFVEEEVKRINYEMIGKYRNIPLYFLVQYYIDKYPYGLYFLNTNSSTVDPDIIINRNPTGLLLKSDHPTENTIDLTENQKKSILDYTYHNDKIINNRLRNKCISRNTYDDIQNLLNVINHGKEYNTVFFYRGIKEPFMKLEKDTIFSDPGFMSKTSDIETATFFTNSTCCLFILFYRTRSKQMYLDPFSHVSHEYEYLTYPGEIFKITMVTKCISYNKFPIYCAEYIGNLNIDMSSYIYPDFDRQMYMIIDHIKNNKQNLYWSDGKIINTDYSDDSWELYIKQTYIPGKTLIFYIDISGTDTGRGIKILSNINGYIVETTSFESISESLKDLINKTNNISIYTLDNRLLSSSSKL